MSKNIRGWEWKFPCLLIDLCLETCKVKIIRERPLEALIRKLSHLYEVIEKGNMWSDDSKTDRIRNVTGVDPFVGLHVNRPVQLAQGEVPFFPGNDPAVPPLLWLCLLQCSSGALNGYQPLFCFLMHGTFTRSEFFLRLNIHGGIIIECETVLMHGIPLHALHLLNDTGDASGDICKGLITVVPSRDGLGLRR